MHSRKPERSRIFISFFPHPRSKSHDGPEGVATTRIIRLTVPSAGQDGSPGYALCSSQPARDGQTPPSPAAAADLAAALAAAAAKGCGDWDETRAPPVAAAAGRDGDVMARAAAAADDSDETVQPVRAAEPAPLRFARTHWH